MKQNALIGWVLGGGALAYLLYSQRQPVASAVQNAAEDVQAAVSGWQTVNQASVWLPSLNAAEVQFGIPTNLLARMAYQESRFRPDVIDGTTPSPSGALGLMQLEPWFGSTPGFSTVRYPIPFTIQNTLDQIQEAGQEVQRLYNHYGDWSLTVAAYNDGQGNVDKYLAQVKAGVANPTLPQETTDYVAEVAADVPLSGVLVMS